MFSLRVLTFNAQLFVAVLGAALLVWGVWLHHRRRGGFALGLRDRALAALGVLGLAAFVNFGWFSGGRFLHVWDTYHYYIGAKYFPELGHARLYACTAVADVQSGLRGDVASRTMTDLHTNLQISTAEILAQPEQCTQHFTAARWKSFAHDISWFRSRLGYEAWHAAQRDHGYNATPVWHLLGHTLANTADASALQVYALVLLDALFLLAAFVVLLRCFGWRIAALAAVMLGTYFPARFGWTGGAFLRFDWLFWMIAGLGALRKDRPLLGGAALAYAALLRLFPAALFAGPAIAALDHLRRTRRLDRQHLRFFAGAALAVALAVPPALAVSGDWGRGFVANTVKHAETPLTNHMGLPTVLSYRPSTTVSALREITAGEEVWPRFTEARREALRPLKPLLIVAALAVLALLWRARRLELWRTAALSLLLVPALLQLTCYYYVFVVGMAALVERRRDAGAPPVELSSPVGAVLLAMCAASMAIVPLVNPVSSTDRSYVVQSAVALLGLLAAALLAVRRGRSDLMDAEREQQDAAGEHGHREPGAADDLAASPVAGAAK